MADKKIKCPFCGKELKPTKKNSRRGYFKGTYMTRCENCQIDVFIDYDDIDFDTVE